MKVKRREVFQSHISEVWRVITDLSDCAWRSDISRIEVFEQGNKFTEISTGGVETRFIVTDFSLLPDMPFRWKMKISSGTGRVN